MKKMIILIALLLAMLLMISCSDEPVQEQVRDQVPVRIATSKLDIVEELYVTIGEVISADSHDLYLPQGSIVITHHVKENEQVINGDLLFDYLTLEGELKSFYSSVEGQVSKVDNKTGVPVQNTPVMRIVDPEKLVVKSMLSSEFTKQISRGVSVELKFENDSILEGRVKMISPEPDTLSRLYETHIEFDDEVLLGEFVEITFVLNSYEAMMVPSMAIVRKNGEKYIYQYIDDELLKTNVETGLSNGEWVELIGVDQEIFQYVISGQNFISQEDDILIFE
jgi:multidrug efflux pump subunit AcrA (membrane-fusion protein)